MSSEKVIWVSWGPRGTVSDRSVPSSLSDCEAWYHIQRGFQSGSPRAFASSVNVCTADMCLSCERMRWPRVHEEDVMERGSVTPSIEDVVTSFSEHV